MKHNKNDGKLNLRSPLLLPMASALLAAGIASPAFALSTTWVDGSGDWNVSANWSSGVPGSGDEALVSSGNALLDTNATIGSFGLSGGQVSGAGLLTVSGIATLSGGILSGAGTSQFNGEVVMTGDTIRYISFGRTVNTAATTTWSGNTVAGQNTIRMVGDATINNGGTWNDANAFDSSIGIGSGGTKVFNNAGTYNKLGDSVTTIYAAFNNTGTTYVMAGNLVLQGGGVGSSVFDIAGGATLTVGNTAKAMTFDAASSFSGTGDLVVAASNAGGSDAIFQGAKTHAGAFIVTSGTAQIDDSFAVPTLTQTGGEIGGAGTLTVSGTATLAGGSQTGAGTSQFNGEVVMTGDTIRYISFGRTVNTAATTTWSGNTVAGQNTIRMVGDATINNGGTWNDANAFDSSIGIGSGGTKVFNNAGTYNKLGDSVTTVYAAFNNTGATVIRAGALDFNGALTNTGILAGNGTAELPAAGFTNEGTIAPGVDGAGTLTFTGDLDLAAASVMDLELASLSSFDALAVGGGVSLGGRLEISAIDGYSPTVGDSFVIMTFAENVDNLTFDAVNWTGFGHDLSFKVIYNADNVMLAAVPEPEQYAMLFAGLGVIGVFMRRRRG